MTKFLQTTMPDGTIKLVRIPKTPEELEEDRKIHERQRQREREEKERRKIKKRFRPEKAKSEPSWLPVCQANNEENRLENESKSEEDFELEMPFEEKFKETFEALIDKQHKDGCWVWKGCIKTVYELDDTEAGMEYAHVVSYKLFKGKIENGKDVVHKCGNPICVNPQHLFLSKKNIDMYLSLYSICALSEDINPRYTVKI